MKINFLVLFFIAPKTQKSQEQNMSDKNPENTTTIVDNNIDDQKESKSLVEKRLGKSLKVDIPVETMSTSRIQSLCSPCDHKAPPV